MSTIPPALAGRSDIGRGIALMVAAMTVLPTMDVMAKLLGQVMPPLEVTLARFAVQAALAAAAALALGRPSILLPPRFALHVARGLCLAGSTLAYFSAIKVMPIPDTLGIFFVEPMILTALSSVILGERVDWRGWGAVITGFAGALLIIRPSWAAFGVYAVLPLGAAVLFAFYLLLTRMLSITGSMLAAQFVTGMAGAVALTACLLLTTALGVPGAAARLPAGIEWLFLTGIGGVSFLCHGLVVLAFQRAPATVLAPFSYLEIVSATALAYAVFSNFPAPATWLGIAVISASGIYIARRERRLRLARTLETPQPLA
jgi:drug/metabolite transporter (DMT)-like permease